MSQKFSPYAPGLTEPWTLPEYPECPVYLYVPDTYCPDRPCGLFFFMHGGDRDTPPTMPLHYLDPEARQLRPHIEHIPFLTVAPAAPKAKDGKRWNYPGVSEFIEAVIASVKERFNVDPDRMILGGHSMGGFGAYHNGALLADRFAGILLSSGAWLEEDFRAMEGTPVYILHGKYDCAWSYRGAHKEPRHHDWCGVSFARAADELMNRYQMEHVYDEHEAGHSLEWEPAQSAFRRFLKWAERRKRNPYPKRCMAVTPNGSADPTLAPAAKNFYLRIDQTLPGRITLDKINLTGPNIAYDPEDLAAQSYYLTKSEHEGARLSAENSGNNHFRIQTENVEAFTLFLAPAMADLAAPIQIELNGKPFQISAESSEEYADYPAKATLEL